MNDLFSNPEVIRFIATVAAGLVIAAAAAAVTSIMVALGIRLTADQIKTARTAWKKVEADLLPSIIEAVNDPNDSLIVALDRYVPGQAAGIMAQALPVFLRALADAADKALGTNDVAPLREAIPLAERDLFQ